MAIAVTPTFAGSFQLDNGAFVRRAVLNVTGLTAAASNTVPHGLVADGQKKTPQVVGVNSWGSAAGQGVTLDSTQAGAGTNLPGYDNTNIYVIAPAAITTAQFTVEY